MIKITPKIAYTGKELLAPIKISNLKLIATGTGRCGTVGIAKILSHAGIFCGHEAIFDCQGLEGAKERLAGIKPILLSEVSKLASVEEENLGMTWFKHEDPTATIEIVADSSYMAAPFLDQIDNVKIVHVVREPIKVINSFVGGFNYFKKKTPIASKPYHDFIYSFFPELKEDMDPLSRAALYYILWNTMIEEKSKNKEYLLYRIEDTGRNKLLKFAEAPQSESDYKVPMPWGTCNHKWGLENNEVIYDNYDCIPDTVIRSRLLKLRCKYYGKPV